MAKFTWQNGTLVSKAKVEINGTIYEVDPEEYSGATPLSAGNLNAMQDGIYDDIGDLSNLEETEATNLVDAINETNEKNNYSTSEKIIGKWIDGKNIYRKVYTFSTTDDITLGVNHDVVVNAKMMVRNTNNQWRPIPWLYNNTGTGYMGGFYIHDDMDACRLQLGTDLARISYGHLIFEYTKNTN